MRRKPPATELQRLLLLLSPVDRRVLAHLWQAPSTDPDALAAAMTDPARMEAYLADAPADERRALDAVLTRNGSMPVATMQRLYGPVREPGGFEHPRAYLDALNGPATVTERLFSRGMIFRTHDERGAIYRVPTDLLALLPVPPPHAPRLDVAAVAAPSSTAIAQRVDLTRLTTTLLTMAYQGRLVVLDDGALNKRSLLHLAGELAHAPDVRQLRREADWPLAATLRAVAVEAGLLRRTSDAELRPTPEALRWLRMPGAERGACLLDAWRTIPQDDLVVLLGLQWRGGTPYTLNWRATRSALLNLLATLGPGWLPIAAIVDAIYREEPDFQRRDGRYDSWQLATAADEPLAGWSNWHAVEGALIAATIRGPLAWLGLVEHTPDLMRFTPLGAHLLQNAPAPADPPATPLIVQGTFEVLVPVDASPYARFQLARIAERQDASAIERYRLTRRALLDAIERGTSVAEVLAFLNDAGRGAVPSAVAYAIRDWAAQADQIVVDDAVVLEAADAVLLARLRADRALGLQDSSAIDSTTLRVPTDAAAGLADRLRRAGYGVRDNRVDLSLPLHERDLRALVLAAQVYAQVCEHWNLPCDITPALLQRLRKLVTPTWADAAEQQAAELVSAIAPDADQAT